MKNNYRKYYNRKIIGLFVLMIYMFSYVVPVNAGTTYDGEIYNSSAYEEPTESILIEIKQLVRDKYIQPIQEEELNKLSYKDLMNSLDKYSLYYSRELKEKLLTNLNKEYVGIGIELTKFNNEFIVKQVLKNSPSEIGKVLVGDNILAVNGISLDEKSLKEGIQLFKGIQGSEIILTISREKTVFNIILVREVVKKEVIESRIITNKENEKMLYINFDSFYNGVSNEIYQLLYDTYKNDAKMNRLIIDLRGNKGGLLSEAIKVSKFLVPKGPILHIERSKDNYITYYSNLTKAHFECIVLVDRNTASASEILASALQESGTALIVGEKTYGKGVIQNVYRLSDGSFLKLTTNTYLSREYNEINGIGINPDVIVDLTKSVDYEMIYELF